jgi:hypothetical protein
MPAVEWDGVVYESPANPASGIVFGVLPDKSFFKKGERTVFGYCWQNPTNKTRRIRVTRQLFDKNDKPVGAPVSATKVLGGGKKFVLDTSRVLSTNLAPGPYKEEVRVTHLYSVNGTIPLDLENAFWIKIGDEGDSGVGSRSVSASSSDPTGGLSAAYGVPGTAPAPGAKYGSGDSGGGLSGTGVSYGSASSSDPNGGLSGAGVSFGPGPGSVPSAFSPVPHTDPPGAPGSPGIVLEWGPTKDSFAPGAVIPFGIAFTPAAGDFRPTVTIGKLIGPNGEVVEEKKLDPPTPGVRDPGKDPDDPFPGGGGPGVGDPSRGSRRAVNRRLPGNLPPGTYTYITEVRDKKTYELIDSTSFNFTVYQGNK